MLRSRNAHLPGQSPATEVPSWVGAQVHQGQPRCLRKPQPQPHTTELLAQSAVGSLDPPWVVSLLSEQSSPAFWGLTESRKEPTRQEQGALFKPCGCPFPFLTGVNPRVSPRCVIWEEPETTLFLAGESARGRIFAKGTRSSEMPLRPLSHR